MTMKLNTNLWVSVAIASTILVGATACTSPSVTGQTNPGTETSVANSSANPCAANPCAANPCAANPCAANPCAANPCAANPCAGTTLGTFNTENGIAIEGADPVAYFTQEEAIIGSPEFSHEWQGATWHFSSAEHRDTFAANPEQYAPQYGGHCAWAVSQGYTAPIDPDAWKIVDGKLYLNYDQRVQRRWAKDIPGNIAKADQNWPGVLTQS